MAGIIENMAWFTPEELPENRYYLFGKRRTPVGRRARWISWGNTYRTVDHGRIRRREACWGIDPRVEKWYRGIAEKIVEKVMKSC